MYACKSLKHMISTHLDYLRCDAIRVNSIHLGVRATCGHETKTRISMSSLTIQYQNKSSPLEKPRKCITRSVYLYKLGI